MDRYPILRSLDPWHARIGYLGALAFVGTRGLEAADALMARFHDLLLQRIYKDDPRYGQLMSRVPPERRGELEKRMLRSEDEDPSAAFSAPAPVEVPPADWLLRPPTKRPQRRRVQTDWLYVSELWLYSAEMPSPLGHVGRDKLDRILQLAGWTAVLLPTLELSEDGYLIKHLLDTVHQQSEATGAQFNPLFAGAHDCLPLMYFRVILAHEILYPSLLRELVERADSGEAPATRGPSGVLLRAVTRLLDAIGDITDPEDAAGVRDVEQLRDSIAANDSTQENYLRPRMEILVDLGFLSRKEGARGKRAEFMWEVNQSTRALEQELRHLTVRSRDIAERLATYLDRGFFASMARARGKTMNRVPTETETDAMYWFARAFGDIGREFGFTPGRTLALKACLLAWENDRFMEVGDVFDAVYRAARSSTLEQYLHFSGGSRFDREFLIRIDDELVPELERQLQNSPQER